MSRASIPLRESLAGRYQIERELGEGGMATVYLADDVRHGRKVAIKVIRPDLATTFGPERFLAEIKLMASLQHPHILGLIDSGVVTSTENGDQLYYVMPYVVGETLRARLARDGHLPLAEAVGVLGEVADALACAHSHGIIHRDIKPENVLLWQGHAMVADFGVAKALGRSLDGLSTTGTGVAVGTPVYMAPEQLVSDPGVDHRADLYSLGVVAYELVTGRRPFVGSDVTGMLAAVLTQPAPSLAAAAPSSPPRLVTLVAALLERDPAKRPQSAASVRDALRSIQAEAISTPSPGAPPPRRTRRVVAAGALGVGLLLVGALVLWDRRLTVVPGSGDASRTPSVRRSIAVLPFENMSRDSTSDYFGDGMAEELISALGRLRGLRVASRTSTFAMKGRNASLTDVGNRLGVGAVLESSFRQLGDTVQITTRLVDVARDSMLWQGRYTSTIRNLLFVQDSIARAISSALGAALDAELATALTPPRIGDPDAYEDYLRGRRSLRQRNPGSVTAAIQFFDAAIRRDSASALAYAGLADAYTLAAAFEGRRPRDVFPRARQAATMALAIDSTLAAAHTSLGMVAMLYDWNWPLAEHHLRRGVELNPSSADGHLFYGWYHVTRGQFDSALAQIDHASQLDPLSVIITTRQGTIFSKYQRDSQAIRVFRRALEFDTTFFFARAGAAVSFVRLNMPDSARRIVPRRVLRPGMAESAYPAWVFVQLGDTVAARDELQFLEAARRRRYVSADALAGIYAVLGDTTRALDLLDEAERERTYSLAFLPWMAPFESIRNTRRFKEMMARIGVAWPS